MTLKKGVFHNASLRLTAFYLVIIMFISLVFSFGLYQVSSDELERNLKQPISQQERRLFGNIRETIEAVTKQRLTDLDEAQMRLRNNLIMINIFIFVAGGGISYLLARRTLKPIEEAHEAQGRFTADASHELRTPITAMRIETELTLTEPKLTLKQAKAQLESNIEELDKLTALSESLLQLARLDHDELEKKPSSVNGIVTDAINRVDKKTKQKKQQISFTAGKDVSIHANQSALTEALVTLLDNASKYSPEKSTISVQVTTRAKHVTIAVQDSGIGIKATELPHIFERFYRADSSRTQSSEHGYGIGLSIAQSIVELHDGTISAESTPGKGSTFTISLKRLTKD